MAGRCKYELTTAQLKPSRLSNLSLSLSPNGPSGSLVTRSQTYSLRSAGKQPVAHLAVDEEGRQPTAGPGMADAMTMDQGGSAAAALRFEGGAEMSDGMRLMVPRLNNGGKLFTGTLASHCSRASPEDTAETDMDSSYTYIATSPT